MKINVKKVNAFTESLEGGNPAGVVLDSQYWEKQGSRKKLLKH